MTSPAPYTPTDADRKFAEASTERARLQAAAYLPQLLDIVAEKALDPTATPKAVLDAAEFAYKVSGLAKKQEEQNDKGRFVFNINFKSGTVSVAQEKVIEAEPVDPVEQLVAEAPDDTLALPEVIPAHLTSVAFSDDLDLDLSDLDD